jgi:5,10-methylenetetrahydromethanopterin reductase
MKISAAFPPVPATPEHIGLAEKLGYSTAWVYDTPALQLDCWMTLALAAARTSRIRLGPGVMIPSLRHPMVTASAIATLVSLVGESRVIIGIGTGFTGRRAMGQKPLRWQDMPRMVGDIRRLLAGETVEIEGAATSMLHWPGQAPNRPIEVPFVLGVNGPKGLETAAAGIRKPRCIALNRGRK